MEQVKKMSNKPTVLKIMQSVARLEAKAEQIRMIPYGGMNPYSYCSECRRSIIEVEVRGHFNHCKKKVLEENIKQQKNVLSIELDNFLMNKMYESKSFKNYCWFKQEICVDELDKLIKIIQDHKKTL